VAALVSQVYSQIGMQLNQLEQDLVGLARAVYWVTLAFHTAL